MNIGNITPNNFNLNGVGKDIQIEVYEQLIGQLQQENKQLKMINKEYERLNKEKNRGFKIINVQEYNIDKLLSYKKYKDNWNKLREYLYNQIPTDKTVLTKHIKIFEVLDKMQKLEQGSDSNVKD